MNMYNFITIYNILTQYILFEIQFSGQTRAQRRYWEAPTFRSGDLDWSWVDGEGLYYVIKNGGLATDYFARKNRKSG